MSRRRSRDGLVRVSATTWIDPATGERVDSFGRVVGHDPQWEPPQPAPPLGPGLPPGLRKVAPTIWVDDEGHRYDRHGNRLDIERRPPRRAFVPGVLPDDECQTCAELIGDEDAVCLSLVGTQRVGGPIRYRWRHTRCHGAPLFPFGAADVAHPV